MTRLFKVKNYNLAVTLDSGQAFRWQQEDDEWVSVIGNRWVGLKQTDEGIRANTVERPADWRWLETYLQLNVNFDAILRGLPKDKMLTRAIKKHRGLRLLSQDPWECLASFILSSTKQITHIKQIVELLCERYGARVASPRGRPFLNAFPAAATIASLTEAELRSLKMGFRAPYLLEAARRVARGDLDLEGLQLLPLDQSRAALMSLPGVGRKIADCVLLFALGFDEAFPVDVWVMRALQDAWFPNQQVNLNTMVQFAESHFGPCGGYAQQYLFHDARTAAVADRKHTGTFVQ